MTFFQTLKTLALVILLLNFKSLPFVWHIRLLHRTVRMGLLRRFLGRTTLRPLPPPKSPTDAVFKTYTHTHRNLLDDSDFFWHMSNSSYNKIFDFIRSDLLSQVFPQIIFNIRKTGVSIAFGGASIVFMREIPMFSKYNLHARIISWSPQGKWLYVQGVFTLPPARKSSKASIKTDGTETGTRTGLPPLLNNVNADPGMESGTSTPSTKPAGGPATTDSGETICAVIYGRYVFKRKTRETVTVPEALEICGYPVDGEMERRRALGWEYVQGLERDWDKDRALESARDI